jgi:hypothetical protein
MLSALAGRASKFFYMTHYLLLQIWMFSLLQI